MRVTEKINPESDPDTLYYEERMAALRKVEPESWDTFLDEVNSLLDAIEDSDLVGLVRRSIVVQDHLKQIRRVR